jgi:hypothetical protein
MKIIINCNKNINMDEEMGQNEMGQNEMGQNEMGQNEMGQNEMGQNEMETWGYFVDIEDISNENKYKNKKFNKKLTILEENKENEEIYIYKYQSKKNYDCHRIIIMFNIIHNIYKVGLYFINSCKSVASFLSYRS